MPKKSKKSKSKRMTLRHKYKVIKKVKQHLKKKAKEVKKTGKTSKKTAALKDPGIPSQWPFKEELVKEFAMKRQQILASEKAKKEDRKRTRELAGAGEDEDMKEAPSLEQLQRQAAGKQEAFEQSSKRRKREAEQGQVDQDGSRRAFYRKFVKVVEAADVIIEVLDARDPAGTRCEEVERFVRKTDPTKKVILLLNKIDLAPREVVESWLKYLREELPTVPFKCSTQKQARGLAQRKGPAAAAAQLPGSSSSAGCGSECLGAEALLQLLKNYARNANLKTAITVGVVGLPNVGKSSLINSLKRARVTAVGNTPGMTRDLQQVTLDKHVKLLDCPGIVFAGAEGPGAVLRNAVRVERLADPVAPVREVVRRCPARQLMSLYRIPAFKDAEHFLQLLATARGKLKKGGAVDVEAAARQVLQDWNDGRIPYYTLPPSRNAELPGSVRVVDSWGRDFNADEVFANASNAVVEHLPSLEGEGAPAFFAADSAGPVEMQLMEEEAAAGAGESTGEEQEEGSAADMDEADGPVGTTGAKDRSRSQTAQLYREEGQYNPHAARAAKKRAKKGKQEADADDGNSSDYDFEDWMEKEGDALADSDDQEENSGNDGTGAEDEEDSDSD